MHSTSYEIIYTLAVAVLIMLALSGFVVYFILISQRRKLRMMQEQQELKEAYEKEILTSQIESRDQTLRDISQEIHDNMGQLLSVARLNMNILEKELASTPSQKRAEDTNKILADVIKYIRTLSKGLNSDMLATYGLRESIRFELQRIEQSAMIRGILITEGEDFNIDAKKEIVLYRMTQEMLNNILKHANAKSITISMIYTDAAFNLIIKDDGDGFEPNEAKNRGINESGSGLNNLEKRAALVGARLEINSRKGEGTTIHITLPKNG